MSENKLEEVESEDKKTLTEELKNVGQIIIGEIESIGGALTGDQITRAEGDLRADEAILREEILHPEDKPKV